MDIQLLSKYMFVPCLGVFVLSCFSHVQLFVILWTIAPQALLSMGFPRQEYWSGLPSLPPGDLPDPGIEPRCPELQADSLPPSHWGSPYPQGYYSTIPSTSLQFQLEQLKRKSNSRTFLVVQWIRLSSQCRGSRFDPWRGELRSYLSWDN